MKTQYTIHDVAALLGISADAIRLYEKEGLVEPERNPQNGYRYYGFDQIHKIMGISLYRQLDVGIAEIREILSDQNFEGISERFSGFIDDTQKEIERLQKKIEKLSYMKQHIDSLAMGIGNCQIKDLPERYILYHQDATELLYRKVQKLITSPVFSYGDICNIPDIVETVKSSGKIAMVHIDLIAGLSSKEIAVDFIQKYTRADGIITTKPALIKRAKELGLYTILRLFVIDSMAYSNIEHQLRTAKPDLIEVLPALMPKVLSKVCKLSTVPVIAGGLVSDKEDVMALLQAGVVSISSTNEKIWFL